MGTTILIIVLAIAAIAFLIWYFFLRKPQDGGVFRLPLELLGFNDIPGVPFSAEATAASALSLAGRAKETLQALNGLSRIYTLFDQETGLERTANARSFLYGQDDANHNEAARQKIIQEMSRARHTHFLDASRLKNRLNKHTPLTNVPDSDPLTRIPIDAPEKFDLSWTNYAGVYENALPKLQGFSDSLKVDGNGPDIATRSFWPLIANHGLAFNLLIPKKMPTQSSGPFEGKKLFQIDMRFFEEFETTSTNQTDRFTPGVIVHLYQDPDDLNLIPYKIEVFKDRGASSEQYEYGLGATNNTTPSMWVYALQAAKTAVTVWGIWLGHVYHWHIVTGALQMTMFNTLNGDHPVRKFLDPMSNYLIGFDDFLLLTFEHIAPPTSFKSALDFIGLENTFAKNRNYHDDDPHPTLDRLGIEEADFRSSDSSTSWNKYPIVRYLLNLWAASEEYVTTYVTATWPTDETVINDTALHTWLDASRSPNNGNIMGIPAMDKKGAQEELIRFLTSYIYRITAHGSSRMNAAANPTLSFVANFPPCLQNNALLDPTDVLTQEELLTFLPNTGTIGSMVTFLFTFVFSAPSESFIPAKGIDQDLFFDNAVFNEALIRFRQKLEAVIKEYDSDDQMIHQWPRNIET